MINSRSCRLLVGQRAILTPGCFLFSSQTKLLKVFARGPKVRFLTFRNQYPDEGLTNAGDARHGGMLSELIQSIAARLRTDLPEQAMALGIGKSKDGVADEKEAKEIK